MGFRQAGSRPPRRGPSALLWGLLFFVAGQGLLLGALEWWRPYLRDPEFDLRLTAVRDRLAEKPGAPLLVMFGTSRVAMGLRPELLACNRSGAGPLVFNFGCCGSTPVTAVFYLDRLLKAGVRPAYLVAEVWPPQLILNSQQVDRAVNPLRLNYRDVRRLLPHADQPRRFLWRWWAEQLLPCFGNRFILLRRLAPGLGERKSAADEVWQGLNGWGWLYHPGMREPDPAAYREVVDFRRSQRVFFGNYFQVNGACERALREMLARCRQERIAPVLLLMPEPHAIRECYSPVMQARLEDFLGRLRREFGAAVVDARGWSADPGFVDGSHLTHAGADAFTRRFEREVLPAVRDGSLWRRGRE